eukprot:scaffold15956_cov32-Cyclotella_meneghiniana.AAC.4
MGQRSSSMTLRCSYREKGTNGYKKWEWRLQESEGHLLHAHSGVMDVYVPSSQYSRRWKKALSGCDVQDLGQPCSV